MQDVFDSRALKRWRGFEPATSSKGSSIRTFHLVHGVSDVFHQLVVLIKSRLKAFRVLQRNKMDSNLWKSNDDFNWKVLAKLFDLNEKNRLMESKFMEALKVELPEFPYILYKLYRQISLGSMKT